MRWEGPALIPTSLRLRCSYTLALDMTGRSRQDAAKAKGLPWSAAKGWDTSW